MLDIVSLRDTTDLKKQCNHVMLLVEGTVVVIHLYKHYKQ